MRRLPILMYHALSREPARERYVLPERQFRSQLDCIREHGRRGISLARALAAPQQTDDAVVLTFDDGHRSDIETVLPMLEAYGCSATFFITTARTGTSNEWMDWDDLRSLVDAGMDVQVHGHSHAFMTDLDDEELNRELALPMQLMQEHLGHPVTTLSFPGGRHDAGSVRHARALGYRALCTSIPGPNSMQALKTEGGLLRRYTMHQGVALNRFKQMLDSHPLLVARSLGRYRAAALAKRTMGDRLYHRVWSRLFGKEARS